MNIGSKYSQESTHQNIFKQTNAFAYIPTPHSTEKLVLSPSHIQNSSSPFSPQPSVSSCFASWYILLSLPLPLSDVVYTRSTKEPSPPALPIVGDPRRTAQAAPLPSTVPAAATAAAAAATVARAGTGVLTIGLTAAAAAATVVVTVVGEAGSSCSGRAIERTSSTLA